jgi:hypothetical protein
MREPSLPPTMFVLAATIASLRLGLTRDWGGTRMLSASLSDPM